MGSILSAEIKRIRSDRKLVRSLAVVEDLFEDNERDQTLKLKVHDIFEQISLPLPASQSADRERCAVEKDDLFESIRDFELPARFQQEDGDEQLHLAVAGYCKDLGVGRGDNESDDSNTVLTF